MTLRIPGYLQRRLNKHWRRLMVRPTVGTVDFGDLRTLRPISSEFGYERGLPIDRYYIEQFLESCREDVHGRVLEIGDNEYTRKYGGDRVLASDVLHVSDGNPKATMVGDITRGDFIPGNHFDSVIFTQTLQFIYDHRAALETLHRILKPGAVLLATVPGITKIPQDEWGPLCAWSFTPASTSRMFSEVFGDGQVKVESRGNVLAACAFLQGLASEELSRKELEEFDPLYPVMISVRAEKVP